MQCLEREITTHSCAVFVVTMVLMAGAAAASPVTLFHNADTTRDWEISLSEILRLVQFFNAGGLHVETGTEDGFGVGYVDAQGGAGAAIPHSSDYAPQDWRIALTELLRSIQFFNSRGFTYTRGTEDDYAPAPCHVPIEGDTDGDGLTDAEEIALGMDPDNADADNDGRLDGRALAAACAAEIEGFRECQEFDGARDCPWWVEVEEGTYEFQVPEGGCPPAIVRITTCSGNCYHPETHAFATEYMYEVTLDCNEGCFILRDYERVFLDQGSFSFYDRYTIPGMDLVFAPEYNTYAQEWIWGPEAIGRLDVVALVEMLFPDR
ncbi:MAG: thrombospondin type 3 repeat-containing protein [Candidatus Hydrogenedentota bacterium]